MFQFHSLRHRAACQWHIFVPSPSYVESCHRYMISASWNRNSQRRQPYSWFLDIPLLGNPSTVLLQNRDNAGTVRWDTVWKLNDRFSVVLGRIAYQMYNPYTAVIFSPRRNSRSSENRCQRLSINAMHRNTLGTTDEWNCISHSHSTWYRGSA